MNHTDPAPTPIVDLHIHIGGRGNSTPCYMSPQFLRSVAYLYMVLRSGIPLPALLRDHDRALREHVLGLLQSSSCTDFGVLLALDAVFGPDGRRSLDLTHMETPNEYVIDIARDDPKVLFGASVHPSRGKAEGTHLLNRCLDGGAVLMKWIPSSQRIDPADAAHDWFFERLADEGLPLLCHAGPEHAVPVNSSADDALADPRRLERALDIGVTVIAAHCGAPYLPGEQGCLDELSGMLRRADARGWNLYADISAMCTFFRMGIIDDVLEKIPAERMVYGSDYPVPVDLMPPLLVDTLDVEEALEVSRIKNPFDRNYRQLLAMGFPAEAMTRAAGLLRPTGKLSPPAARPEPEEIA